MAKSKIVTAVGVASSGREPRLSQKIEAAMSAAVLACNEKGITDPDKIREAMLEARGAVKGHVTIKAKRARKAKS
jgi:hypothetical protein